MKRHIFLICVLGFALSGCTEALVNRGEIGPGSGDAAEVDAGYEGDVDEEGSGDGDGADGNNGGDATGPGGDATGPGGDEGPGEDPGPQVFVRFVKPTDGARVRNPVQFKIEAQGVERVQVEVDTWPLRHDAWDPERTTEFEYTMTGVNKERIGVLFGYDANGEEIARDTIRFFVEEDAPQPDPEPQPDPQPQGKGTSVGKFENTYYYMEMNESRFSGPKDTNLYDPSCKVLATVPAEFARLSCIEGTTQLADDRVLNYHSRCSCSNNPCNFCWSVMGANAQWGLGNRNNPLEPLVSWAIDTDVIDNGTVMYVEEFDGVAIPKKGSIGGFTHDGCFRADDVGSAIKGKRMDIFAGTPAMWQALEGILPTGSKVTVYVDSPRCEYLKD